MEIFPREQCKFGNSFVPQFMQQRHVFTWPTSKKILRTIDGCSVSTACSRTIKSQQTKKSGKEEHHLWKKRDSSQSGQKAQHLVNMMNSLPNEKEAVYGALDKWVAWETEFPVIAAAKALRILKQRSLWRRVIQLAKWMLSKGQVATMSTYDTLLLAFDTEHRIVEAESLYEMILRAHTRSLSKVLFSRMISLYHKHDMHTKVIEVFADMEELRVKPDEDMVRRVSAAFKYMGEEGKQKLLLRKYLGKWKYVRFEGQRVRVTRQFD